MPKFLMARQPVDGDEEKRVRRLAGARHAPADWILRARIIALSWEGLRVPQVAARAGCHPKTVRRWLHRFNDHGLDGLGDRPGCGRKRRITEAERSRIIALVRLVPPGRLERHPGGDLVAGDATRSSEWTLDALAAEAGREGITVSRSQVRRILLAEGVRWRRIRSWARSRDPEFVGKGRGSSSSTPARPRTRPSCASTSSAR
ncbi:MAG TPA: helix-turn-helix domain-containing protein [Yinghuangia sp.]|nr:helix-turn-helix domain-containing protein [Yinghuangia sp.]